MNLSKLQETGEGRGTWRAAVHGVSKSRTGLDWTTEGIHHVTRAALGLQRSG